eukprot:jgi/Orpsp1_1/1182329/evm.model.c7180000080848.1
MHGTKISILSLKWQKSKTWRLSTSWPTYLRKVKQGKSLGRSRTINLTIKDNEELEDFNCNYLQLYQQIDAKLKDGITVQDYLKSIRTRKEVCRIVLLDQCTTIEEAIKSAEKILKVWEFESLFSEENKPTYRGYQSHSYDKNYSIKDSGKVDYKKFPQKKLNKEKGTYFNKYSNDKENSGYPSSYIKNANILKKEIPVLSNTTIQCYRCQESGHKVSQCPYDDEELIQIL